MKKLEQIDELGIFTQSVSDQKSNLHFQELIKLSDLSRREDKPLIIQGGFAVDLAVGYLSRKHDDLDLLVLREDLGYFKEFLVKEGYEITLHEGMDGEWAFNAYKYFPEIEDRVYIDFDGIEIAGEVVADGEGRNKYVWPMAKSELFWERKVAGSVISFLSPYVVYMFKKKQQSTDKVRDKEGFDFSILEKMYPDINVRSDSNLLSKSR